MGHKKITRKEEEQPFETEQYADRYEHRKKNTKMPYQTEEAKQALGCSDSTLRNIVLTCHKIPKEKRRAELSTLRIIRKQLN